MHVEIVGRGPRLVLVHGSVTPGWMTWNAQKPLSSRFTLVVPIRTGYPPNPPLKSIDFEEQARELSELLQPGDHLVGHSYGAVVSLLAAPGAAAGVAHGGGAASLPPLRAVLRRSTRSSHASRGLLAIRADTSSSSSLSSGRRCRFSTRCPRHSKQALALRWPSVLPTKPTFRSTSLQLPSSQSWSSPAATARRSTRSATSSRSGSAPSEPSSRAQATRSRGRPGSTRRWSISSSGPNNASNRLLLSRSGR